MNSLFRFKLFLWKFGLFKVPMIGYLKPRLIKVTNSEIILCIPLKKRSRNHLNSMYFGALAVGADLAGGLLGFYHAKQQQCKVALVFKSFQAQFLRRPEADVYFVCSAGEQVAQMIRQSNATGERVTQPVCIKAYTDYPRLETEVAEFVLELSVKKK